MSKRNKNVLYHTIIEPIILFIWYVQKCLPKISKEFNSVGICSN